MKNNFKAPEDISKRDTKLKSIFLAGSIDMDKAVNWQKTCEEKLKGYNTFNPRRASWDNSWKQEITNPEFKKQVDWELDSMEEADIIIMYLGSETLSPISLLELGLHASSGKIRLVVGKKFWRKGNVDIVAHRYNIKTYESLTDLIEELNKEV